MMKGILSRESRTERRKQEFEKERKEMGKCERGNLKGCRESRKCLRRSYQMKINEREGRGQSLKKDSPHGESNESKY